jgi:heme/copper-type cytochrome/quinol oxidase subunit 3
MSPSKHATEIVDLSELPDYIFGSNGIGFWGGIAFMLIEGMGFVLAIGAYFYLIPYEKQWPPSGAPPPLFWATTGVVLAVLSEIPNLLTQKCARRQDLAGTRLWLIATLVVSVALLVVRGFECHAFNVRWDQNAYGSINWGILVMHYADLITDVWDMAVLVAMLLLKPVDGRKFADCDDNAAFWHFLVVSWIVVYVVMYWVPRWV